MIIMTTIYSVYTWHGGDNYICRYVGFDRFGFGCAFDIAHHLLDFGQNVVVVSRLGDIVDIRNY